MHSLSQHSVSSSSSSEEEEEVAEEDDSLLLSLDPKEWKIRSQALTIAALCE